MKRLSSLSLVLLFFVTVAGCADDPVTPPPDPNLGKRAPVTVFHAHNDLYTTTFVVRSQDTVRANSLSYGMDTTFNVQIGTNSKLSVALPSGTPEKKIEAPVFDSLSTWVVVRGGGASLDAFSVSTKRVTPAAGKIGIRVINASENVSNKIQAWVDQIDGAKIGDPIDAKESTNFTILSPTGIAKFVISNSSGSQEILSVTPQTALEAGKLYTVIIYGSGTAGTIVPLKGKLVTEP